MKKYVHVYDAWKKYIKRMKKSVLQNKYIN